MVRRWWLGVVVCAICLGPAAGAADLTSTERAWLEAAAPVLSYARAQRLPLDIIVQPQPTPGETPLGMAYVDGRCKLVLSMRGNPQARETLDSIPRGILGPVVEAIAAHELGHCWRHVSQRWGTLPAGMEAVPLGERFTPEQVALLTELWRTRREEAYADLVGLAWTHRHHPGHYTEVHAWLVRQRAERAVEAGPHDTRSWIRLAGDPAKFSPAASLFAQVEALWSAGLLAED
jgi:hypothetical protein